MRRAIPLHLFGVAIVTSLVMGSHFAMAAGGAQTQAINPMTKVSTPLRTAWNERKTWHARRRVAECFVKIHGSMNEAVEQALTRVGFKVRSVIPQEGTTILTGTIVLHHLFDLADIPFVESIDGAVPIGKKGSRVLK